MGGALGSRLLGGKLGPRAAPCRPHLPLLPGVSVGFRCRDTIFPSIRLEAQAQAGCWRRRCRDHTFLVLRHTPGRPPAPTPKGGRAERTSVRRGPGAPPRLNLCKTQEHRMLSGR